MIILVEPNLTIKPKSYEKNSTHSVFTRLLLVALIFSFPSCEKDELDFNKPATGTATATSADLDNLRRKVENPYTIPNMQKTLDSLMSRIQKGKLKSASNGKASIPKTQITPNMLYIKFSPQTPEEEGLLQRDSTLALIDYPLGYEYDEAFFENRPPLKEGEIPSYYTTVAVDRDLPMGVPYEVLEEMYLPQEDEEFAGTGKSPIFKTANNLTADFVTILLHQAFAQTGNEGLDGLGIIKKGKAQSQNKVLGIGIGEKWLPKGKLRIWDDNFGSTTTTKKIFVRWETYPCDPDDPFGTPWDDEGEPTGTPNECKRKVYRYESHSTPGSYVPLAGAQVLLRDTFTIGNEITNSEGYFQFDHKRGKKRYIIQWERYQYSIRNGSFFQAELRGPKLDRRWNHSIRGGDDEYHGMIHLAAHDYYYGSRFGLTSPPTNSTFGKQLKIAAREKDGRSSYAKARSIYFGADISLQAWGEPSEEVYGTTIHELAHAAHREVDRNSYDNLVWDAWISPCAPSAESCDHPGPTGKNNRRLMETWASTVEIMFVLKRYRTLSGNVHYVYEDIDYQYRKIAFTGRNNYYTSAGYDMIDDINQRDKYGNSYPADRVSGFSIKQLEEALINARSWWQWRDNLKKISNIEMDEALDELFNNWKN